MGVGNPYMKDDGIGIEVAKELRKRNLGEGVEVIERQVPDLSVLLQSESSYLILVDALKRGKPAGTMTKLRFGGRKSPVLPVPLSHELRLDDLIELARRSGISARPITVIGVEPADCGVGDGLTPAVARALPLVVSEVVRELKRIGAGG